LTANDQAEQETMLTAKQETFILAMLSAPSIVEAARIAGIGEKTGRRWLKLPHVHQAYQAAQQEVFEDCLTTLKLTMHDAVLTLRQAIKDTEIPASTRVRAAQIIIEQALELHKVAELEQQIAELQELVKDRRA
jgi:phage terminase small subunit